VPVVLITIANAEIALPQIAQKPSTRIDLGASLPALMSAPASAAKCAVVLARPRNAEAVRTDQCGQSAAPAVSGKGLAYQLGSQKFAHTTLTIADGAGDLGPHPAREPV
jgi:hypothetical protein